MTYTMYLLCEPGMDRPCVSHTMPSEEQRARLRREGGRWYTMDVSIPDFELADGRLRPIPMQCT